MCYIAFIGHSLHWRYIKAALQEYVINKFITDLNPKPGNAYGPTNVTKRTDPYVLLHLDALQLLKIYRIGSRTNSNL